MSGDFLGFCQIIIQVPDIKLNSQNHQYRPFIIAKNHLRLQYIKIMCIAQSKNKALL